MGGRGTDRGCGADLPSQARRPVLNRHDRGDRRTRAVWTSFGSADWSDRSTSTSGHGDSETITDLLRFFATQRVSIVRLDAVGYVVKKPGTSCFMVEPEI